MKKYNLNISLVKKKWDQMKLRLVIVLRFIIYW